MKHALIVIAACAAACVMAWGQTKSTAPAKSTTATKASKAKAAPKMDLLKPETIKGKPPEVFITRLQTTKGNIDIRVARKWAPNGVERFYNLVRAGYYDNTYFFRVLDFMAQVGISSDPQVYRVWGERTMFDDRVIQPNIRGTVTFAASGEPNSRSTQFFINKLNENVRLDSSRFAPFGEVVEGMEFVDQIYAGYGDSPNQAQIAAQGGPFIERNYPRMDKIIKATILQVVEP